MYCNECRKDYGGFADSVKKYYQSPCVPSLEGIKVNDSEILASWWGFNMCCSRYNPDLKEVCPISSETENCL